MPQIPAQFVLMFYTLGTAGVFWLVSMGYQFPCV